MFHRERLELAREQAGPEVVPYVPVYESAATPVNASVKGGAKPKLSPEQLTAMLQEKADGRSVAWLSQKYRISESNIYRLAKEARDDSPARRCKFSSWR